MPRHCIIEFNNPITGQRQTSLLGYILNQQGINVNDVNALLENLYQSKASQGFTNSIKLGVPELFESNPELANAVYEAAGFKPNKLNLDFKITTEDGIRINVFFGGENVGGIDLQKSDNNYFVRNVGVFDKNQGIGTEIYKKAIEYVTQQGGVLKPDFLSAAESYSIYKKLEKEGLFKIASVSEQLEDGRYEIIGESTRQLPTNQITSQQKQQAQQLYSQYLDTIFPDSKVKDIVYHGTKGKKFDEVDFSKNIFGGSVFYVSTDKREAKGYAKKEGSIVSLLINAKNVQFQRDAFFGNRPQSKAEIQAEIDAIKNSKFALEFIGEVVEIEVFPTLAEATEFSERNSGWEPLTESVKQNKLKELNNALVTTEEFDTVLTNNDAGERTIYIVNQAEQIHILGNKQDIEGFKKFVEQEELPDTFSERTWNTNNNLSTDFIEPRISDLAEEFDLEIVPGLVDQINLIQDFYDSKNIHLGTNLNLLQAKDIIKDAQDLGLSLELEVINPEEQPSDRIYRVYPVNPTQANNEAVNNFIYEQLSAYYEQVGAPNALNTVSNYVDVTNPTLVGMLKNILNDPSTTQFEKDIMNTMLTLLKQFPEINVNFSKDLMLSELNPDNLVPARYDAKTNTITLYTGPLSNYNSGQFKHILMHELTHALFFSTLKNPQTQAEKVFASEIKRIYEYYKAKFPNAAYVGQFYGLTNEHEFLSEFFSNPEFRSILEKEAPVVHGSIYQSVLNFFKKLFNQFLTNKNRQDTQYLTDLTKYFFNNVLSSKINTSGVYTSEDAFNYEVTDQVYNDFLKSIPGKNSFDKFYGALDSLLNNPKINWQSIFKHAKATGIQLKVLTDSVDVLQNIEVGALTRSDLKTSFKAVMTHLSDTHTFLRNLKSSLSELEKNQSLPEHTLFSRAYHAKNIGQHYKKYIEDFKSLMDNPSSSSPMGRYIYSIEAISTELIGGFDSIAAPAIASKFADYFWEQTNQLRKEITARIQDLTNKLETANRAGNTKKAQVLQKELTKETERLKAIATKQNLEQALKGVLVNGDSKSTLGSRLGAFIESAALSGDLIEGSLAGFVDDLHSKATEEALVLEKRMKSLSTRLQNHLEAQGKRAVTSLGFGDIFGKYIRRVTVKEIKRVNGVLELSERDTYVLQTEMDEVSYLNRHNELRYEILKLENKENKTEDDLKQLERLIDNLADFEEQNLESLYTEEYHRIQNILSEPARKAREEIINQMRQIQVNATQGDQTDEDLDRLEDLKTQLDELENPFGKTPEQQEIAYNIQQWKQERRNANLYVYKLTETNRAIFNDFFDAKKAKVREAELSLANLLGIANAESNPNLAEEISQALQTNTSDRVELAKEILRLAQADLAKFKRNNVVKKVKPEFYELRNSILEGIENIQSKYRTEMGGVEAISELYQELFTLLKPYKNQNGEYVGSKAPTELVEYVTEDGEVVQINVATRVKDIENRIDRIRDVMSEGVRMSKVDKDNLFALFDELKNIQTKTTTEDYKKVVAVEQAKARTAVISELGEAYKDLTNQQLQRAILKKYRASEWYKQNHRDFKPTGEGTPLFHWRVTLPTNPNFISQEEPSFRWYTIEVNDATDPNTGKPLYINKDVQNFRYSKRVPLKRTSGFRNSEYQTLDSVEKEIISEVVSILGELEDGLPTKLKLGTELPAYMKTGLESLNGKVGNLKDQITSVASNLWDRATGKDQEDPTDKVSLLDKLNPNKSELNKYSDRIHLKYLTPIEADKMSINFFESITQFGADALRFKNLYENMAYIFGTRDLVTKNLGGTVTESVVNNIIERKVNGKSRVSLTGNPILNAIGYMSDKLIVGLTAKATLSVNLPSAVKNFTAGSYNIYTQAGRFGINRQDIAVGKAKAAMHLRDFYRASVEDGVSTPYIQKVRYFNIMPEDHLNEVGKKMYRTSLDKTANYNPLRMYAFTRQALEFEMRVGVAEALSKQHLIELNNGQFIPIMEAYTSVGGVLVPRADIKDLAGFSNQESYFKGRLNLINSLIHGAYGAMDKAEYQRYAIGRFIMMMRNWFGYQWLSRFGSRRMSIRAGMEFEGMYRTLWNVLGYKGKFWQLMSYSATSDLLSNREKENLKGVMFDTLGISVMMGLSHLISQAVYSDDDDDVDNPMAYLMLYNLLYLEDELNTLHPVFGPAAIAYSRIENKVSGDNFATYYFKKYFTEPFRVSQDIGRAMYEYSPFGDLGMFDEYVPLSKNGKVMNPNRYKPDPFLQGMPDILARTLKLFALDKSVNYIIGNQEFMYRKYDYLNPKYFTDSYEKELRQAKRGQRSNKLEIKAIKEEIKLIEDPDTKELLYEKIERLEAEIERDKEAQEILEQNYSDYTGADRR